MRSELVVEQPDGWDVRSWRTMLRYTDEWKKMLEEFMIRTKANEPYKKRRRRTN